MPKFTELPGASPPGPPPGLCPGPAGAECSEYSAPQTPSCFFGPYGRATTKMLPTGLNSTCPSRKLPEFSSLKRCFLYFGNLQLPLCYRKSDCYALFYSTLIVLLHDPLTSYENLLESQWKLDLTIHFHLFYLYRPVFSKPFNFV